MPGADAERPVGAYGLRVRGLDWATGLLATAGPDWPQVRLGHGGEPEPSQPQLLNGERAVIDLRDAARRRLVIDRAAGTATFQGRELAPDQLVHPYLWPVASIFSRWLGREALHGGAVVLDGGAWGVLGPADAGKSTLLAAFAAAGTPVVSDDLAVVEDGKVLAGPRCIDLRAAPPAALADRLGAVRARRRSRWRVHLSAVEPEVPLRGWVFLAWEERAKLTPLPERKTLTRLLRWRAWAELGSDTERLRELASLPAFTLGRPRRMAEIDDAVRLLA
jgi:hypothetical protein